MKKENFFKAVGITVVGLGAVSIAPVIGTAALVGTAAYLYSKAPRTSENFVKLVGAVACAIVASPTIIGAAAIVGFGALSYNLLKQKDQAFYGKPFETKVVEKLKSMTARR